MGFPCRLRAAGIALVALLAASATLAAVPKDKAKYVGGTAPPAMNAVGTLSAADPNELSFQPHKGKAWQVPYTRIKSLRYATENEYRSHRKLTASSILLGERAGTEVIERTSAGYLTIDYQDAAGKTQVAVFELGRDLAVGLLPSLEARTGLKIRRARTQR